jgi:hypothetical protein
MVIYRCCMPHSLGDISRTSISLTTGGSLLYASSNTAYHILSPDVRRCLLPAAMWLAAAAVLLLQAPAEPVTRAACSLSSPQPLVTMAITYARPCSHVHCSSASVLLLQAPAGLARGWRTRSRASSAQRRCQQQGECMKSSCIQPQCGCTKHFQGKVWPMCVQASSCTGTFTAQSGSFAHMQQHNVSWVGVSSVSLRRSGHASINTAGSMGANAVWILQFFQ